MAFYTWIDSATPGTNVMAASDFSSDSQRSGGFTSGTVASSIRVNTALRQSTLITNALMKALGLDTFSYTDATATIETQITDFLDGRKVEALTTLDGTETSALGFKIGSSKYEFPSGGSSVTANPTLSGTEADLGSLTVAGTKYKVFKQLSGTFKYSLGGVEVSGGKYILQGNKLTLYFNGNFLSYLSVSGTQLTLIDESSNWNNFNTSDSQNKVLIGSSGTSMYFASAVITHSGLSPYIVLTFDNVKLIVGSTINDGTFSGYYMQYLVNTVVDFIL